MPDLTIVPLKFCASWWGVFDAPSETNPDIVYQVDFGGGEAAAHCTCKAFRYSNPMEPTCKHIERVYLAGCFYNEYWHTEGPNNKAGRDKIYRPKRYNRADFFQRITNPRRRKGVKARWERERCPHCGGPMLIVMCGV